MHHEFAEASIDPQHMLIDPPDEVSELVDLIEVRREDRSLEYRLGMG